MPSTPADFWPLDPSLTMLNHGSFGSCPRPILELQQRFRAEMEARPVDFLTRRMPSLLDDSRATLAELIGADQADVVFVSNVTAAANAVLRSLRFRPGDELLVTNHDYNAVRNVVRYVAEREGAKIVVAPVPLPLDSPEQIVGAVLSCATDRTRLALLDHVTSPTALVFPIEELVRRLAERGVDTLVDGAHAPGMVPLDVRRIGAAYYGGNCHKWTCAPKGAGFLYVRPDRQEGIQPPVISHGYNTRRVGRSAFQDAFDWPGTIDPTAWFCVGPAIRWLDGLFRDPPLPLGEGRGEGESLQSSASMEETRPTALTPCPSPKGRGETGGAGRFPGLDALMRRNHAQAVWARRVLCERLGLSPLCPERMLGSLAAVRLPDDPAGLIPVEDANNLGSLHCLTIVLRDRFSIEVPVFYWPAAPQKLLRISAQAYNAPEQYERLADVLAELL
jgi:isopenicillin-N epimerase